MAQLRRSEMRVGEGTRFAALVLAAIPGWACGQTAGVVVRNLEKPGAAIVENHGPPVVAASKILVERKQGSGWIASPVLFDLVTSCSTDAVPDSIGLPAGAMLKLVPWNGYTCSGQCPRSCRSNHYAGPGIFRFVVFRADHSKRFTGPEFVLPPEKPLQ
jgi:hypothetical protein